MNDFINFLLHCMFMGMRLLFSIRPHFQSSVGPRWRPTLWRCLLRCLRTGFGRRSLSIECLVTTRMEAPSLTNYSTTSLLLELPTLVRHQCFLNKRCQCMHLYLHEFRCCRRTFLYLVSPIHYLLYVNIIVDTLTF